MVHIYLVLVHTKKQINAPWHLAVHLTVNFPLLLLNSKAVIKKSVACTAEPKGKLRHRHWEEFSNVEEQVSEGARAGAGLPGAHRPLLCAARCFFRGWGESRAAKIPGKTYDSSALLCPACFLGEII